MLLYFTKIRGKNKNANKSTQKLVSSPNKIKPKKNKVIPVFFWKNIPLLDICTF